MQPASDSADPLVRRIAAAQADARARATRLRGLVPRLASELRARGARRVRLFGSLATGVDPHAGTDVDLAVDGMDEAAAADALLALEEMTGLYDAIDLVLVERASARLLGAIERDGLEVDDVAG